MCQSYKKNCVCNQKIAEIYRLAKTDLRAYYEAMKDWGRNREKRFFEEGWRKMRAHL
ncbi:MAG: hypothetical protein PVF79_07475 [Desulfobacterales bacterium]|jgi:hypothetical protein